MKRLVLGLLAITYFTANAQEDKYGATPEIQEKCKQNISLYREFRDQKNYDDAIGPWREAVEICPKAAKTLYIDGAKFYKYEIKKEKSDAARRDSLVNELLALYDKRIEHFGQKATVLGYKGNDAFRYKGSKNPEIAYEILKEAIEAGKASTHPAFMDSYYRAMFETMKKELVTKTEVLEEYIVLSEYMDAGKEAAQAKGKQKLIDAYDKAAANMSEYFVLIATCDDIEAIAGEKFEAAPDDLDNVKKLMKILAKRECTDGDVFTKVAAKLNELDPSHESAYALTLSYLKQGQYGKAVSTGKQAIEMGGDELSNSQKLDYYLATASAAIGSGQASTAATYARKAAAIDANNGKAYLLIGDAIATSAKSCAEGEFNQKAIYWLAVDYYQKAKRVDQSVAATANGKIGAYKQRFPDNKLMFQYGYTEGSAKMKEPIKFGCWINESVMPRM